MSGNPAECRAHARDCLLIAESASSPKITRMFVDLAHSWTKLALELEDAHASVAALRLLKREERQRLRHAPKLVASRTNKALYRLFGSIGRKLMRGRYDFSQSSSLARFSAASQARARNSAADTLAC